MQFIIANEKVKAIIANMRKKFNVLICRNANRSEQKEYNNKISKITL